MTQQHIAEDLSLQQHHCENPKSLISAPPEVIMLSGVWKLILMDTVTDTKRPEYSVHCMEAEISLVKLYQKQHSELGIPAV